MRHLIASTLYWGTTLSCGVLVHNEVLHRSTHLFSLPNSLPDLTQLTPLVSPLLLDPSNAPSLQSGAFFPDWGYQCLSTDAAAEAAHWPPFLVASVEHIIAKYGLLNGTTTTTARDAREQQHLDGLIAFVFAVAAHQTQDASWHAIRLPSGFLAALAAVDFGGDVERAHRVLDFGGDFMVAARLARMGDGSRGWISPEWKVPVDDIVDIYKRTGREVNKFVLRYCTMRGLAALRSDLTVGPSLLDSMASQSPMLVNSLDDYYLGGLDEMTSRTVSCWSNLTRWLANGIDADEKIRNGWGICDLFRAIKARGGAGDTAHPHPHPHPEELPPIAEYAAREIRNIQVHTDEFGAETYSLPPLPEIEPKPRTETKPAEQSAAAPKFLPPTYIATYTPYGHFGSSISVGAFTPDSAGPSIAVGAPSESEDSSRPGEGNVYILPLSDILPSSPEPFSAQQPEYVAPLRVRRTTTTDTDTDTPAAAAAAAVVVDQRFGTASAAWRVHGMTLLAVSAPGPLTYGGGAPGRPFAETALAGRIDLFRPGEAERWISLSVRGAELGGIGRRWWGETMLAADMDGSGNEWLVVSGQRSDGRGTSACDGREKVHVGEGEVGLFQLVPASSSSSPEGEEEDIATLLHHHHHTSDSPSLTVKTHLIPLPPTEQPSPPCSSSSPSSSSPSYAAFGTALTFHASTRTLLISGTSAGKTFAYSLSAGGVLEHTYTLTPPAGSSRVSSLASGAGWIAVGHADEDAQRGVVRLYALPTTDGATPRLVAEVTAQGAERYAAFGRSLVADTDGGLWVGSDRWDGERGAVWWVDVLALLSSPSSPPTPTPPSPLQRVFGGKRWQQQEDEGEVRSVQVDVYLQGDEPNARFAGSLAVVPSGGGGGELVVGVPYAGVARGEQGERFYGAVAVYRRV